VSKGTQKSFNETKFYYIFAKLILLSMEVNTTLESDFLLNIAAQSGALISSHCLFLSR
jgi:hypothetical protein